ncbi:MAG: hypothetical protein J7K40_07495 [candidate division Zixibacteria bacterium]|nr:hypothetical protein [candidate division Zixibacteria bacterium]
MKKIIFFLTISLALILINFVNGQEDSTKTIPSIYDPLPGYEEWLKNRKLSAEDASLVEKAYQYMEKRKDYCKTDDPRSDFKFRYIDRSSGYSIKVKFWQIVNGIILKHSFIYIGIKSDGSIRNISGRFYPQAWNVNTTPTITKEQAKKTVFNDSRCVPTAKYHGEDILSFEQVHADSLIILEHENDFHLCWKAFIPGLTYYVDAHTDKIIRTEVNMIPN